MPICRQPRPSSLLTFLRIAKPSRHTQKPVGYKSIRSSSSASGPTESQNLRLSGEIARALHQNRPIVALESTIYTHGFPYPENLALAFDLERIVRKNGAIPATIGVVDGIAIIGLSKEELTTLASSAGDPRTMKISRRDLPFILGKGMTGTKLNGGTTIAATMLLAHRVRISVFGTGGLGGVHRGAESTMDISADLTELGRTSVAVVSSGCKSFLDIPRTLEYLETQGVTVCTFADGRTGRIDFPAFYTRESGSASPLVVQSPREAAAMIRAQERMFKPSDRAGLLFANPIPEEHAMLKSEIDKAIEQAVREAADQGFHGHTNTPFILSKIKELTKGNSIPANRALIESNVAMAAKIAVELAALRELPKIANQNSVPITEGELQDKSTNEVLKDNSRVSRSTCSSTVDKTEEADIIVIGSVAMDVSCDYSPEHNGKNVSSSGDLVPELRTSNIATISQSVGGVGYNVALAAQLVGSGKSVSLRSFVGPDLAGTSIISTVQENGLDTSKIIQLDAGHGNASFRTAQYVAVNDVKKDLVMAMADMSIFSKANKDSAVDLLTGKAYQSPWVVIDANWAPSVLGLVLNVPDRLPQPLVMKQPLHEVVLGSKKKIFEPVSVPKAGRIFNLADEVNPDHKLEAFPNHQIHLTTPNQYELAAMHATAKRNDFFESQRWWEVIDALGIPSTGARDRFVSITNHKLTDEGIPLQTIQLLPYVPTILTKLGDQGVLLTELLKPDDPRLTDRDSAPFILSRTANGSDEVGGVYMRLFPPAEVVAAEDVVSVNGVGDTFLGVLVAGLAQGCKLDDRLIDIAQRGAVMTLKDKASVSPKISALSLKLTALAAALPMVSLSKGIVDR